MRRALWWCRWWLDVAHVGLLGAWNRLRYRCQVDEEQLLREARAERAVLEADRVLLRAVSAIAQEAVATDDARLIAALMPFLPDVDERAV